MMRTKRPAMLLLGAAALILSAFLSACSAESYGEEAVKSAVPVPDTASEGSGSEEAVQEKVDEQLAERRKAMLEEAHAALDETHAALKALDEGERDAALEALARATGKLELLVARDPELALAPVDVDYVTHDLYATPNAIRIAREQAEELLEDGEVQQARALLSGLASEIVISVTSLPLATYPAAIKAISPLVDEGKLEEAEKALRTALNTLVVTDHVISLPVLRAGAMLDEAEGFLGEAEPSEDDRARVGELIAGAREQLEMAELLGYGAASEHKEFRRQIAELEKKIGADEETGGAFARLRKSLDGFQTNFLQ